MLVLPVLSADGMLSMLAKSRHIGCTACIDAAVSIDGASTYTAFMSCRFSVAAWCCVQLRMSLMCHHKFVTCIAACDCNGLHYTGPHHGNFWILCYRQGHHPARDAQEHWDLHVSYGGPSRPAHPGAFCNCMPLPCNCKVLQGVPARSGKVLQGLACCNKQASWRICVSA